jgi:hypothetical protein
MPPPGLPLGDIISMLQGQIPDGQYQTLVELYAKVQARATPGTASKQALREPHASQAGSRNTTAAQVVEAMLSFTEKLPEARSRLQEALQASGLLPGKRPRAAAVASRQATQAVAAVEDVDEDEEMREEEEEEDEEERPQQGRQKKQATTPKAPPQLQPQPPAAAPREAPAKEVIGGVDQAEELRAMLPGRGGGGVGGRGSREGWLSATSVQLGARLMSRGDGTASMLAVQGVGAISPGAAEALTAAVVDRLKGVLEGVREHVDWRTSRGHVSGAGPPAWVVVPGEQSLQQRVWDIAARETRLQEQRLAAAKAKKLAEEEAALKNRRPGAPPLTAEEQARVTSLSKMRAEQEAIVTNAATANAARQAMGTTAAGAKADKWAHMQRTAAAKAAAGGDEDGDGMDVDRAGAGPAQQAGGHGVHATLASKEVTVRDVATYLQRDPCATPRLLGVAAERLRRTEQPWSQQPATAPLLRPLVPKLL